MEGNNDANVLRVICVVGLASFADVLDAKAHPLEAIMKTTTRSTVHAGKMAVADRSAAVFVGKERCIGELVVTYDEQRR